jgi:hypothetical protein
MPMCTVGEEGLYQGRRGNDQKEDSACVTNTPPYVIETKTVIQPESKRVQLTQEVEEY